MALLEAKNLGISFGGLRAVDDFNIKIEKGSLYGLIGPNGAGKTTVFNLLTGVYKPTEGIITLDGKDVTGKKTIEINQAGIARTFQNIRLFKDLSVIDNVKVGLHNHMSYSTVTGILRLPKYYKVEKQTGYGVQDRCLTGAVGSDQCNDLSLIYVKGHTLYGLYHAVIYFNIIYF
jgi:branched-chain amino acid transport system ATP-binding protein